MNKKLLFFAPHVKKLPCQSTKERKAKLRVVIKEFNDKLLN